MPLPAADTAYLLEHGFVHEITSDAGMLCIIFPGWKLPAGYNPSSADLLLRLPAGYPDVPPDMWWFDPAVRLADGRVIPGTEVTEQHVGRSWQRWSRHFQPGQWHSGIDGLESFLALLGRELQRWVGEPVR